MPRASVDLLSTEWPIAIFLRPFKRQLRPNLRGTNVENCQQNVIKRQGDLLEINNPPKSLGLGVAIEEAIVLPKGKVNGDYQTLLNEALSQS